MTATNVPSQLTRRVVALVDAATIATDASLCDVADVTLGADRVLGAPTHPTDGQLILWRVRAAGHALTYNAIFRFSTQTTAPTLGGTVSHILAMYCLADNKWDVIAVDDGTGR